MFRLEGNDRIYNIIQFSDKKIHLINFLFFRDIFQVLFILK